MKKKGAWSKEEDQKLAKFIKKHGLQGLNWETISENAGLNRCGKSCRLRWKNYLSPHIRRGNFSEEEESIIVHLQSRLGNKWSQIAAKLPGRTDNDIKNLWNTKLKKKLQPKAISYYSSYPQTPTTDDPNFLANYLINIFGILLGFLNKPEIAQNLLVQELCERKRQELVMPPTPNYPFLHENYGLDNGNGINFPFEFHANLISDASFEGGSSANSFGSNDLTEYDHMLPTLVSASDEEIRTPMVDEFCVINPNSLASFDSECIANEMNYQSPDLGSAMQLEDVLVSCLGFSPSLMDNASSSNIYDGASSSLFNDFQSH